MDVDLHRDPNPALAQALLGAPMRRCVEERAHIAALLYQAEVAKRTGALARTAHAGTEIGGIHNDRVIGVVTIGRGVDYGASHEFGTDAQFDDDGEPTRAATSGARDLNAVLEQLAAM